MRSLILGVILASVPSIAAAQSRTTLPVDERITFRGVAADSSALRRVIRKSLEADTLLRLVYRPPRDSLRFAVGQTFEVAVATIYGELAGGNARRVLELEGVDNRNQRSMVRMLINLPMDIAPEISAPPLVRDFARMVSEQIR
jgi:hypothetical protein